MSMTLDIIDILVCRLWIWQSILWSTYWACSQSHCWGSVSAGWADIQLVCQQWPKLSTWWKSWFWQGVHIVFGVNTNVFNNLNHLTWKICRDYSCLLDWTPDSLQTNLPATFFFWYFHSLSSLCVHALTWSEIFFLCCTVCRTVSLAKLDH